MSEKRQSDPPLRFLALMSSYISNGSIIKSVANFVLCKFNIKQWTLVIKNIGKYCFEIQNSIFLIRKEKGHSLVVDNQDRKGQ